MSTVALEEPRPLGARVRQDSDLMHAVGFGGGVVVYTAFVLSFHAVAGMSLWTLLVPATFAAIFAPLIARNLLIRRGIARALDPDRVSALSDGACTLWDLFLVEPGKPLLPMQLPYLIDWEERLDPHTEFDLCRRWLDELVASGLVHRLPRASAQAQPRYQAIAQAGEIRLLDEARRVLLADLDDAERFQVARPGHRARRSPLAE